MSDRTKKFLTTVAIIVGLVLAAVFGLKWFNNVANDNADDYDGGKGRAEEIINDQLNG